MFARNILILSFLALSKSLLVQVNYTQHRTSSWWKILNASSVGCSTPPNTPGHQLEMNFPFANNTCPPGACEGEARTGGRARRGRRLMGEKRAGLPQFKRRSVWSPTKAKPSPFSLGKCPDTLIECVGWKQIANCEQMLNCSAQD